MTDDLDDLDTLDSIETSGPTPGDFARYAITQGWDPIPLYTALADGTCECGKSDCRSIGKHPKQNAWQRNESITAKDTYGLWDTEPRMPNVGLRTGDHSGFWALDIDPKAGGVEALAALVAHYGPLPATRSHRTGSGGTHYLFRLPPDFKLTNSRGRLPVGIDVRGNGGFIVAPGSVSGVGPYSTLDLSPIAPAPEWLLDQIRPQHAPSAVDKVPSRPYAELTQHERGIADRYLKSALDGETARLEAMRTARKDDLSSYRGEPWNETTFMVACNLLELAQSQWLNFSGDDALEILRKHAPQDPGFTLADIGTCARSAMNKVKGSDRPMPAELAYTFADLTEGIPYVPFDDPASRAIVEDLPEDEEYANLVQQIWIWKDRGGKEIQTKSLVNVIKYLGPIRKDAGGAFWEYRDGVFAHDPDVVDRRVYTILGEDYRTNLGSLGERAMGHEADAIDLNDVAHPNLVNFRNTMVEWRTGFSVDHSPEHGSTFQVACDYDPRATCPLFDSWVDAMLSPDAGRLLWQVIGYSMLSGNPLQSFVYLDGPGGNGKGVALRLLISLLGAGNVSSVSWKDIDGDNRFKLSQMVGKAANIAGEVSQEYVKDSANLKAITGGDWLDVERKGQQGFMARIHALPIFSGNEVPQLADDSGGLFQRVVVIPFRRSASEFKIEGFSEEALEAELPGIARRALDALRGVKMSDLTLRGEAFTITDELRDAKRAFQEATNAELEWLRTHVRKSNDSWVTPKELYRAFGGRGERVSRKFMRTLAQEFGETKKRVPASRMVMGSQERAMCYEVEFSEDPFPKHLTAVEETIADIFG